MTETTKHPLAWPQGQPRTAQRKRANFHTGSGWTNKRPLTVAEAMGRLRDEIARMNISFRDDCVVSSNLVLNLGGEPRSGQPQPKDPGVAVYWVTRDQQRRVMAIDIYDRVEDNIAAVARTLEYMRGIERHGGAAIQERAFTGFTALPAPKTCWEILAMDPPKATETRDDLVGRIRSSHRAGMITLPRDHQGDVIGAASLNAARDEALGFAAARGR